MKKMLIESWITTIIGILIAIFSGFAMWYEKTPLWGSVVMWAVAAIFIFADEEEIKKLFEKALKLK